MRRTITIVLTLAFIVGITFVHNKRITVRECARKRLVPGSIVGGRCAVGLGAIRSEMFAYAAEWNIWSSDIKTLGLADLNDKYYEFDIILASEDGYVASCVGNLDGDEMLDIWVSTSKDSHAVNLSNDCDDSGKIIDMRRWKEEATNLYNEAPNKSL